ncbi:MAG: L-lactate dehydrogenase complex protein LldG [Bacteroidales bacterium]|jgi:L-lactate dehydrogenase complex protein LldG|nr:L-lactate dehydrogenase complex protein LldG [Bacteroidales bacterium]NLH51840.1 LUD domain-containing protein [Bacteroidales bacterium]NPV36208.1 LUD domain-containing protein [Bacteroidales bacterium]
MKTTPKEQVLKSIRDALIDRDEITLDDVDFDSPIYPPLTDSPDIVFARNFIEAGGKFNYCTDEDELAVFLARLFNENIYLPVYTAEEKLRYLLMQQGIDILREEAEIFEAASVVSTCEFLVARTGTIVYSSALGGGRRPAVVAPTHVVVAYASQVVNELRDALAGLRTKYGENLPSAITFITGPSRTADIEKTLVKGAHGPAQVLLFFVDDLKND